PADAPGDPKCGYRAGDSLQMAIQHYDNGASQYINYQLTPVSGNPAVYQAGGSTSVAALKALRKPAFFKVNPLILNPSHKGEDYKVRGRSSDFDWTVSEHEAYDWISIPEPGGEAKTEYDKKIVFEPNTGTQPREAKLLFRSTSTHPDYKNFVDTVRIIQRGTNCAVPTAATITTSPASPCAGREFTLTAAHSPANPYYEYQWGHGKTGSTIKEIAPDLGGAGNIGYSLTVFDRACGLASAAQTLSVPIGASTAWVSTDTPTQGNLINGEKSGTALARFGDWVALGSPEWNASANVTKAGRVLLYKRTAANTWTFKQQLNAPTQAINEFFGYALSMQGDLLLVGAPAAQNGITVTTPSSTKPGAAYLFRRNADDTWSMTGNKMTSGSTTFDNFGTAVALQGGEYAFVGADAASSNKVCIFHRDEGGAGTWGRLSTSLSGFLNGTSIGRFGCSLAADGEYLAVGAKNTGGVGAVFIFEHAPQLDAPHLWGQVNALQVPAGEDLAETDDRFGHSVALRGNYLLVGAPYHDNDNTGSNSNRGAAWLYERDISAGWKKVRKILPSGGTPADDDFFGSSLSLGDGYAAIGAEREGSSDAGAAYLYHQEKKDGSPLKPFAFVRRFAPNTGDAGFGGAVCVSARSLLAGAPLTSTSKGKVYFYKPACTGQEQGDERQTPIESYQPAVTEAAGLTLRCYPLPFHDELLMELSAERPTSARIEVLDLLGRPVGMVYDGPLEGQQAFRWEATALPPGSYWMRVSTEQGQLSQQLLKM
ncbi:MAG TPA: hypothetical protein PK858_02225, partial [Saprospiraceae bacterium]|nr:hypothetical protein [Saprospiraceae bacterium]